MHDTIVSAPAVDLSANDHQYHHAPAYVPSQEPIQATPEQLYQYHLFMNSQKSYSPSLHSISDKPSTTSTSAVVETVLAVTGMIMMLIVGVLGYQQMNKELSQDHLPDMSGFIVTLATIPIAVAVLTLLMKLAVRRSRLQKESDLEGQIALPGECGAADDDLGAQGQGTAGQGLVARFWSTGASQGLPLMAIDQDLPPAYEERATQTPAER